MDRDDTLRRLRAEAQEQVERLDRDLLDLFEASRSSNADDEHDPEGSTIAFERAQVIALLAAGRRRVTDLDGALARSAAGTYGTCETCGEEIPAGRLAVRPFATTCVRCAGRT